MGFLHIMFSYYENSHSKSGETITFPTLVSLIQEHPRKAEIQELRCEPYGTEKYRKLKSTMPVLTPHCTIKNNGAKDSGNVDSFSNYFYFDVDAKDITPDVESYKQYLLDKIGNVVCLLGKSIGGRGLFFYVKVADIEISHSNFQSVREYLINTYLEGVPIDKKCSNGNRLHFVPFDKDVSCKENEVYFKNINLASFSHSQYINKHISTHCISRMGERFTSISTLYKKYNFETHVEVVSPFYDVKPVENYKKIYIPKVIKDGFKHKCFSTIANQLIRLNDSMTEFELLSFLYYVNKNHTGDKPMMHCKLENLVRNVYKQTKENGLVLGKVRTKNIHFNKANKLSKYQKIKIANRENGIIRKRRSVALIQDAIKMLREEGLNVTQLNVAQILSGRLSRGPIEKYWREILEEISID